MSHAMIAVDVRRRLLPHNSNMDGLPVTLACRKALLPAAKVLGLYFESMNGACKRLAPGAQPGARCSSTSRGANNGQGCRDVRARERAAQQARRETDMLCLDVMAYTTGRAAAQAHLAPGRRHGARWLQARRQPMR